MQGNRKAGSAGAAVWLLCGPAGAAQAVDGEARAVRVIRAFVAAVRAVEGLSEGFCVIEVGV